MHSNFENKSKSFSDSLATGEAVDERSQRNQTESGETMMIVHAREKGAARGLEY